MPHPRLEAVTREDVIRAAKSIEPRAIQKWSVVVNGKEFPVTQALMEAANSMKSSAPRVTPADFITHDAVRRLKRLGFTVNYAE